MAQIVLGMATSHTPMLNAPADDWPRFIERDCAGPICSKRGAADDLRSAAAHAPADIADEITPEPMRRGTTTAQAAIERLGEIVRDAELDALIVVGDDQKELYHATTCRALSSITARRSRTCRSAPASRARTGRDGRPRADYEEKEPRDYPVDAGLALHLIDELIDREFDTAPRTRCPRARARGTRSALSTSG